MIKRFFNGRIMLFKLRIRQWRDNRRLVLVVKLLHKVCKDEMPGVILRVKGEDYVVQDIQVSLYKNKVTVVKTKLKNTYTRNQRAAINQRIKALEKDERLQ